MRSASAAAGMAATVPIVLALRPERPHGAAGAVAPAAASGGR
jgi:hypothetical protein